MAELLGHTGFIAVTRCTELQKEAGVSAPVCCERDTQEVIYNFV